jgi:hypothetical protein
VHAEASSSRTSASAQARSKAISQVLQDVLGELGLDGRASCSSRPGRDLADQVVEEAVHDQAACLASAMPRERR